MDKFTHKSIFSDEEIGLLKTHFKDNEELVKLVRKAMIDWSSLAEEEKTALLQTFNKNEQLVNLIRKIFIPSLDLNAPLGGVIDLWMTIRVSEMTPDDAELAIEARERVIRHLTQQWENLALSSGLNVTPTKGEFIDVWVKKDKSRVNLMARNTLLTHVEQVSVIQIWALANKEELTEEERQQKVRKNSVE